ncbi:MAG: hypothetical protein E7202_10670 [Selenomonas ruminantium]|jgi:hypothetical protein|nr:hypothetical protein [Selenomonas ruminantium]
MKKRILVLVAAMMMALSGVCMAHMTGGSINGLVNTDDGQKIAIFTAEGYSVGTVLEYPVNYPLEDHDVIEAIGGYLTQTGRLRIKDMHNGSSRIIVQIEGVKLTETEAMGWLAHGGKFY